MRWLGSLEADRIKRERGRKKPRARTAEGTDHSPLAIFSFILVAKAA
jgi:hypothetical protein